MSLNNKIFKIFFLFTIFIFNLSFAGFSFAVEKNDPSIVFLSSISNMSADYVQEQYEKNKTVKTEGKIVVKKPDSIMLTHRSKQMKLKIVSVNGNVKMIDEDLGQTTYVDNQYSELMQFFTKNLKPEKLKKNKQGDLCMSFSHLDNKFEACLRIDLQNQTLVSISVFVEDKDNNKNKAMFQIMDIKFKNVRINKGIDKKVFLVKDSRIFDEEDE